MATELTPFVSESDSLLHIPLEYSNSTPSDTSATVSRTVFPSVDSVLPKSANSETVCLDCKHITQSDTSVSSFSPVVFTNGLSVPGPFKLLK